MAGLATLVAGLVVLHGLSAVTAWEKSAGEQETREIARQVMLTEMALAY